MNNILGVFFFLAVVLFYLFTDKLSEKVDFLVTFLLFFSAFSL